MTTGSPNDHDTSEYEGRGKYSLINLIDFIDRHQGILNVAVTTTAIAGVITIGRSVRLVTKFQSTKDIPKEFVRKHVQLRGQVQKVQDGVIAVNHLPILPGLRWNKTSSKKESNGHLRLVLAGVSLEAEGRTFVKNVLKERPTIWFRLLSVDGEEQVEAIVKLPKHAFSSTNLNIRVLQLGLGKTRVLSAAPSRYARRLTQKLLRAEIYSEKKKLGLWKAPSLRDRLSEAAATRTEDVRMLIRSCRRQVYQIPNQLWTYMRSFFRRK